ncbi:Effector protein NopP [Bradyrhizobium sp. B097]|uniref:Effector protein NopP n=1 Tax=Bradyrhizobium sp. B097 TaxID=3140244 RepID=UPI0031841329
MDNRISDSSMTHPASANGPYADDDSQRLADMFCTLNLAPSSSHAGSSSTATRPYSLVSEPPVVEISRSIFEDKLAEFYGDEIGNIAAHPQRYSARVSEKAQRTADIAFRFGTKPGSEDARYFSYQLGSKSVGLLRTEAGGSMSELFKGNSAWRERFLGCDEITSTIDFRVTHPLVENAGDILLEHQLRIDGDEPLVLTHSFNSEAKARAGALGFVEVSDSMMVLDPTKHGDKWKKNRAGEWQRDGKPPLYLAAAEVGAGSDAKHTVNAASPAQDPHDDEYDFM